jgi:hypothetical protein
MGNKSAKPMQMSARAVLARRAQQQMQQQDMQAHMPVEGTSILPGEGAIKNTESPVPTSPTATVPVSNYVSVVEGEGMPQIESSLLQSLAKMDLIKSQEIPVS